MDKSTVSCFTGCSQHTALYGINAYYTYDVCMRGACITIGAVKHDIVGESWLAGWLKFIYLKLYEKK